MQKKKEKGNVSLHLHKQHFILEEYDDSGCFQAVKLLP